MMNHQMAYDYPIVSWLFAILNESRNLDLSLSQALEAVGTHYGVSRCFIFEDSADQTICRSTAQWCADGVAPEQDAIKNVVYTPEIRKGFRSCVEETGLFGSRTTAEIPGPLGQLLQEEGIYAVLLQAIYLDGTFTGFIGMSDCTGARDWTAAQIGTISLLGSYLSVSIAKKRERESRELSEDVLMALDESAAYVLVIDPETHEPVYMNDAFHRMLGHQEGTPCYQECVGRSEPCENCPIRRFRETGSSSPVEVQCRDGRWLLSQASPVRWKGRQMYLLNCTDITEQRTAMKRLQTLTDSVPGGILGYTLIDGRLTLKYFNDTLCTIIGYGREEYSVMAEKNPLALIFEEDLPVLEGLLETQPEKEGADTVEFRVHTKTGAAWIRLTARVIEKSGSVVGIYAILTDITEQKKVQERLRIQEEAYRIAVSHANSLVYHYDLEKHSIEMPPEVAAAYGLPPHLKNVPESIAESGLLDPESMDDYYAFYDAIRRGKAHGTVELRRRLNRSSPYRWYRGEYTMIYADDGSPVSAVVSFTDIDMEKQAEAENIMVKRDRDMLIAATRIFFPLCIISNLTKNSYYMLEYESFSAKKAADRGTFDELIEAGLSTIPEEEDRAAFQKSFSREGLLEAYRQGKKLVSLTHRQKGDDGVVHWNRTAVIFVEDPSSDDLYQITLSNCVDDLKQSEYALKTALAAAQKANQAKSEFLSNMSHDLRTPLNTIINLAYLADDDVHEPEKLRDDLRKIAVSSEFMLALINDILDMSRIESGQFDLHEGVYRREEFISCIESMIVPLCESKDIRFLWEREEQGLPLWVDKTRFNQIFFNLLSNAVKFTNAGGTVRLQQKSTNTSDGFVVCEAVVSDTGCGMSEEFQQRMFLPFERENTADAYVGTGLGLAITKNLVERMGGTISVASRKGFGTAISLRIPVPLATEAQIAAAAPKIRASAPQPDGVGRHILVAEDHPMNQTIVRRILQKKGYDVECVQNGQEAVEKIAGDAEKRYMAVLMDVRMPVMDGISAAKAIRRLPNGGQIPIIAMTANTFDEDVKQCLDAGMNAFLSKPVVSEKLYEALSMYL